MSLPQIEWVVWPDTQLYSQILGIEKPWKVTDVQVSLADHEVEVSVGHGAVN